MCGFLLDSEVVVVHNLNRALELVELSLHELRRNQSEKLECGLDTAGLSDLFALFNVLLFALLYNLPKLI